MLHQDYQPFGPKHAAYVDCGDLVCCGDFETHLAALHGSSQVAT